MNVVKKEVSVAEIVEATIESPERRYIWQYYDDIFKEGEVTYEITFQKLNDDFKIIDFHGIIEDLEVDVIKDSLLKAIEQNKNVQSLNVRVIQVDLVESQDNPLL